MSRPPGPAMATVPYNGQETIGDSDGDINRQVGNMG